MPYLRLTLIRPRPGGESEAQHLLEELDESLAGAPGMLFSLVMSRYAGRVGRVSLWTSKDAANKEAVSTRTLALRSRIRSLSVETEETFMEVSSGFVPDGFTRLVGPAETPLRYTAAGRQQALLAS